MISVQFSFLLLEAHLEEETICFEFAKKSGKNVRNTGKIREFLERKKVTALRVVTALQWKKDADIVD